MGGEQRKRGGGGEDPYKMMKAASLLGRGRGPGGGQNGIGSGGGGRLLGCRGRCGKGERETQ